MPKKEDIRAPSEERMIREIPIDKIDPFPDHPYKVLDNEDTIFQFREIPPITTA